MKLFGEEKRGTMEKELKQENINKTSSSLSFFWIPTSNLLPEGGHNVLFCDKAGNVGEGCYNKELNKWVLFRWRVSGIRGEEVVAWMPMPEPYKGEE